MPNNKNDGTTRGDGGALSPAAAREAEDRIARGLRGMDAAADRAAGAVAEGADRAREKFDRAMDGVKRGAERAREGVHTATGRAEETVEEARERLAVARESLADLRARSVEDVGQDVAELIRNHPGKAVLVAGLVGFVLGSLATRGHD